MTSIADLQRSLSPLGRRTWDLIFAELEQAKPFMADEYVSAGQAWGVMRFKIAERAAVLATRAETELYLEDERSACRARVQNRKKNLKEAKEAREKAQGARQVRPGPGPQGSAGGQSPDRPG